MSPLGVNKTVLLGVLSRKPALNYGLNGEVRALLSLTTRVLPVGSKGEITGAAFDDSHLVYCEGVLAKRMAEYPSGALVYLEGRNREQRMKDPGGKSHRLAFVSATVVRHVNDAAVNEGANTVTLLGTVMRDPIVRYTTEGICEHTKLRLQTTQCTYADDGETRCVKEYHWVGFYGRMAQFVATRAQEGCLVFVEGRNQPNRWADNEGLTHRSIIVVGHYFQLLHADARPSPPASERARPYEITHSYDVEIPDDELAPSA